MTNPKYIEAKMSSFPEGSLLEDPAMVLEDPARPNPGTATQAPNEIDGSRHNFFKKN